MVDCKNQQLEDNSTRRRAKLNLAPAESSSINLSINEVEAPESIKELLQKFPYVTSPQDNPEAKNSEVFHRIHTGGRPPVFAKTRQLSQEKLQAAQEEFRRLQATGVISPSQSQWSSPLHLVKKPNGEFRPCGDYRALNSITTPDRYPIPNINSFNTKLKGKSVFSKIDLTSAYHQLRVHPEDVPKTAVTTPFGLFEYSCMPFGLRNAAATFQRFMDNIFNQCSDFVFVFIDDLLIHSTNESEHVKNLENVFSILNNNNLKISLEKCQFFRSTINFLGFEVSVGGVRPTREKLEELQKFPYPQDSKGLRRLIGMLNFYRKLVPNFSSIMLPLTERMRLSPKDKFTLNEKEKEAFHEIVKTLSDTKPLAHPSSNVDKYQLVTDSSNFAIGAALHQMIDGQPVPIGFFSKKLTQAQCKYSAFDRELLAAYLSVLHFRHLIEGRQVMLLTDHKPLVSAFHSLNPAKSDRQQRHLAILTEYISEMAHIKGDQNVVADCLSRPTMAVQTDLCDLPEIVEAQSKDEEIKTFPQLKEFQLLNKDSVILCDMSTPYPRPFIPVGLRESIFNSLHALSHPGIKATQKLIKSRYFWPDMDKSIRKLCHECSSCQQSKIHRHTKSPIQNFELPSARFQTVHIDIVGPLPPVKNDNDPYFSPYRYLLTCIDRSTRWIEAQPMTEISAQSVASAFVTGWIARFGVPLHVITDRGTQFESELFTELSKILGFHRLRTTAYHPQCNGMIERTHRTLKTAIMARKESWLKALPIVLLGIRSTPKESGFAPFQAVTGTSILLPQLMLGPSENNLTEASSNEFIQELNKYMLKFDVSNASEGYQHKGSNTTYVPDSLAVCDKVWVRVDRIRKPLEAPYTGPYKVLRRSTKHFLVEINPERHISISIDRLKPFVEPEKLKKPRVEPVSEETSPSSGEVMPDEPDIEETNVDESSTNKPRTSSSGRKIRWKEHNDFHYF